MSARSHPIRNQRVIAVAVAFSLMAAAAIPILHSSKSVAAVPGQPITQAAYPNFADVVANVQPAVVNIAVTSSHFRSLTGSDRRHEPPFGPWSRRFFERHDGYQGGHQPRSTGVGSGFIIDADGHIVTNYHVVNNADTINVTLNDGSQLPAVLIGGDEKTDLALLKVEIAKPLPYVEFGESAGIRAGDWVVAIGNPFGLGGSVTAGILSARGRDIRSGPYDDYLQIDAPINRGNSGGPLFDLSGRVIGVNTAIFSPNGGSVGIGFAIPTEIAKPIIEDLLDDGRIERGWLGVQIQSVTPQIAESLDLGAKTGALVAGVAPASPAADAGIVVGDVIVSVAGDPVDGAKALTHAVAALKPHARVTMSLWRQGRQESLSVEIGEKSTATEVVTAGLGERPQSKSRIGVSLAPITPHLRGRFGIPANVSGVIILNVEEHSPAGESALREGDVIIRIGDITVETPGDVARGVKAAARAERGAVLLLVGREGGSFFVAVPFG